MSIVLTIGSRPATLFLSHREFHELNNLKNRNKKLFVIYGEVRAGGSNVHI